MKTTIPLFSIVVAFLGVIVAPQARATCQEGCLTNNNTVLGEDALLNNTGSGDTAIGWEALFSNTAGSNNTAVGTAALIGNTTGQENTAIGVQALNSNTTGSLNTAIGLHALASNIGGLLNTATGNGTLGVNTSGSENTATGDRALASNSIGNNNTATGAFALYSNTTGKNNTANGVSALVNNTTGGRNIALGFEAGVNLTTGGGNIDIGNPGRRGESNTIRIGKAETHTATFIAGISGATVPGGIGVIVDSSGHLGTTTSSARFKDAIQPMDKASEAILALRPVTFRYKHELDPAGIPQFGLVAEDVEKVNPDLVARDEQGKPYTVRYEAVNAMLLNEFLKEHRQVENQQRKIESFEKAMAEQQKENAAMRAMLDEQATQIRKVSAQLELSESASQTALNNH